MRAKPLQAVLACLVLCAGTANATQPFDPAASAEMAATLRDMIAWPQVAEQVETRVYLTPAIIGTRFAPQSDWGRQQLAEWAAGWQEAFDRILLGLEQRGELAQALSPAGLKIPLHKNLFKNAPDLALIDRLMTPLELPMCDQDAEIAECFLELQLQSNLDGRMALKAIRFVRPDGSLLRIPGKVQE